MRATMILMATGLAGMHATSIASAAIDSAVVERTSEGVVVVRWTSTPKGAPVDVALVLADQNARVVSDDDRDGRHELSASEAASRPLVRLTPQQGASLIVAERVLPLRGGRNFRDLGGYPTSDGRRVKWGYVYRSGTMSQLTDDDYALLSTLGIRVVCDFRATEERDVEPTLWRTSGAKASYRARDYRADSSSGLMAVFSEGTPTPAAVRAAMMSLYGELAYEHADSYRTMFKSLASGEVPLAFNCSAGKDRTGVAAALLLTLLGVPRETVVQDYALSEKIVNYEAQYSGGARASASAKPGPYDFIAKLPADVRAPLMRSDPEYIRAALAHIEHREGSIDAYFERVLGVGVSERERIRKQLLEESN